MVPLLWLRSLGTFVDGHLAGLQRQLVHRVANRLALLGELPDLARKLLGFELRLLVQARQSNTLPSCIFEVAGQALDFPTGKLCTQSVLFKDWTAGHGKV